MKTKYGIRYKTANDEFFTIAKGTYTILENAMRKVSEMRDDKNITNIVLKCSNGLNSKRVYVFDNGFEVFYL